ncbi:hypothetical protein [Actinoplanes sp. CA-252034]|uniref:hypothetical protein n=1 Tax=Actinoplanes sp. CA-252034 TaxID=3239906 RepID=UPI003D95735A
MARVLRLFADYHQIHVTDPVHGGDLGEAWTEGAAADRLAVADGVAGVGTAVDVFVEVTVDVLETAPDVDPGGFDHVVEGAFEVGSGRVLVLGCTDGVEDAAGFDVPGGWTRIRVSLSNLEAAWRAGVDSDDDPGTTERVLIQLWPSGPGPVTVLKRWTEPES